MENDDLSVNEMNKLVPEDFRWLIRTDRHNEGYFVNIYDRSFDDTGIGISSRFVAKTPREAFNGALLPLLPRKEQLT